MHRRCLNVLLLLLVAVVADRLSHLARALDDSGIGRALRIADADARPVRPLFPVDTWTRADGPGVAVTHHPPVDKGKVLGFRVIADGSDGTKREGRRP